MKFNFYKLEVWQLGLRIVKEVYKVARDFPSDELYGLTSQTKRAAVSIPLNIAEGSARRTKKDFRYFIRNALGSCMELQTCLEIARQQSFVNGADFEILSRLTEEEYFKLIALEKSLKSS